MANQGNHGNHDQHVKAGQQSHKNDKTTSDDDRDMNLQSRNNERSEGTGQDSGRGTQGGSHEQHVNAGRQSHKNS